MLRRTSQSFTPIYRGDAALGPEMMSDAAVAARL
jgi:hypothetical protein